MNEPILLNIISQARSIVAMAEKYNLPIIAMDAEVIIVAAASLLQKAP